MSNHAARVHPNAEPQKRKYALSFGLPALMVAGFLAAIPLVHRWWTPSPGDDWIPFRARVMGTRIAIVGNYDDPYRSGGVDYRIEAHVRYRANGVEHDGWLPTSKASSDKLFLKFWLTQHSKTGGVVWENPHNPGRSGGGAGLRILLVTRFVTQSGHGIDDPARNPRYESAQGQAQSGKDA